ncbi:hypothetical protein L3Y34_002286 [Caenorhabditis briggsae]|uniref:Uncharacterized protein n=1 Tax=Caenorhabditis briggsae TaxID=6238 RepID=A0AAE9IRI1_CAEBR|nr:hypothetical protein L3Y34_002286 [Caenorhabditis briggsae]
MMFQFGKLQSTVMTSAQRNSSQDGAQYPPGGILLICTYPEEHGICDHVNNIVAIHEHFAAHTKCFRFVCQCGKQFAEQVSVCDHRRQCAIFFDHYRNPGGKPSIGADQIY